ncbi:MAG: hypothetical protein H8E86_07050 [Planctomycetes bacterium]|nr:hypothetical protein [Planctomycetota bacterium]
MRILPFLIPCCLLCACEQSVEKDPSVPKNKHDVIAPTSTPSTQPSLLDETERTLPDKSTKYTYTPPQDNSIILFGAFQTAKPTRWNWVPKNSASLLCKYEVVSESSDERAIFTVRQFASKDSGDLQFHIQRWTSQFNTEDGRPIKPKLKNFPFRGKEATQITISGEYTGESGTMHQANKTMLIVVFEEEGNTYFFKLFGQNIVVKEGEEDLHKVLENLKLLPALE